MCNDKLNNLLNVDAQLLDFNKEFQSDYRLMRYLKESGKIVLPQTMLVDKNDVQHTFQYVLVLQQLHQLLSVDEVFMHVIAGHQENFKSMVLHDFCDGSACVSDEFFKENQTALRIIHLYADEFEPCKGHTHTTQPFYGSVEFVRTTRVSRYQKKYSPTHSLWSSIIHICFLHLLRHMASSVFNPRALQSFPTISLQVFFGLSWPGTLHFILHTFLHSIIVFFLQHRVRG